MKNLLAVPECGYLAVVVLLGFLEVEEAHPEAGEHH